MVILGLVIGFSGVDVRVGVNAEYDESVVTVCCLAYPTVLGDVVLLVLVTKTVARSVDA